MGSVAGSRFIRTQAGAPFTYLRFWRAIVEVGGATIRGVFIFVVGEFFLDV
jgi:hypothetical protein